MLRLLLFVVLGAAAGSLLGFVNQCAGGTCPLMCLWWRGAIFGAVAGLALFFAGGSAAPRTGPKDPE